MRTSEYDPHFSLILASNSPRRKQILTDLSVQFTTFPADTDETLPQGILPAPGVGTLALRKALAGGKAFFSAFPERRGLILGADTMVCLGNDLLGKPHSPKEAHAMLSALSGRTHFVYTGIFLADADKLSAAPALPFASVDPASNTDTVFFDTPWGLGAVVRSAVTFRPIDEAEISASIAAKEPFDKAGGYAIQGSGSLWATSISGDYFNIVGLPVCALDALCVKCTGMHLTQRFPKREGSM